MITNLDVSFTNKVIKSNLFEFRFKYNTQNDYFYYDLFDLDGEVIEFHQKVVTGLQRSGYKFTSDNKSSYATLENISGFKLVTDE
jgi:hypothetical protein